MFCCNESLSLIVIINYLSIYLNYVVYHGLSDIFELVYHGFSDDRSVQSVAWE